MKRLASILVAVVVMGNPVMAKARIPDSQAVRAIIGEAADQPFSVQLAVACAIRHRGSLRGVYGTNNPIVRKASPAVIQRARRAWLMSLKTDVVHGLKYFGCDGDARYFARLGLKPALRVGAITFYQ